MSAVLDVLPDGSREGVRKTLSALWAADALPADKSGFVELASQLRRIAFAGMVEEAEQVPLSEIGRFLNGRSYDAALVGEKGTPIIRISNMTDPTAPTCGQPKSIRGLSHRSRRSARQLVCQF